MKRKDREEGGELGGRGSEEKDREEGENKEEVGSEEKG